MVHFLEGVAFGVMVGLMLAGMFRTRAPKPPEDFVPKRQPESADRFYRRGEKIA